ncbi:Phostensin [Bagarius yarrelli]|uniref:Phostensin n=1 Tax=Bagarius yarrelli TaxID=175774 RepID=A0A556VX62_BAGYA|nr:Phostensin [Bagarius yarrelli]
MSRIYKPVSSRSDVCITERNLGIQTHSGGMIKLKGGQLPVGAPKIQTGPSVQSVQHRVEQFHLREQEVQKKNDEEEVQNQSVCEHQKQTEQTKPNPSATTKAPLFTIRSASGGRGKRGTTFTITPRGSTPSVTPSSSVPTSKVPSSSSTTPDAPSNTAELSKKRYPTAEEIEVMGGYQKLERSCLMKNRRAPKTGRVSFDDCPVRVYTYSPEASVVDEEESSDNWRRKEEKEEELDEDVCMDEVTGLRRVLRVGVYKSPHFTTK